MKKFIMSAVATASVLCAWGSVPEETRPEGHVRIAWDRSSFQEMTSVWVSNEHYTETELHYPRIKELSDGTLLMSFMNDNYGWDVLVRRSEDGGKTWSDARMIRKRYDESSSAGKDEVVFVNPDFIELQDGRIMMAYQWRYKKGYNDIPNTNMNCGIEIMFSEDMGQTFSAPRRIYTGRCWEPAMLQLPSGEIQMYITDSHETLKGVSQPCTILIRSLDNGVTWQGKKSCTYADGEIVSRTIEERCTADGMPTGVWLDGNYGIAVPLEVWSGKYKMDQTPVVVRTDADSNWHSDQSIRREGGPEYPLKKQLNKDFIGFGPYSTKLPTGEMVVLSNGTYKNREGVWVFIGNQHADDFRYATTPFTGHWGSIACVGNNRVIGTGTFPYDENDGQSHFGVRVMNGRLNYSKEIEKGGLDMIPMKQFDRENNGCWFLGKEYEASLFADFGYTDSTFIFASWLFDRKLAAFSPENSDAASLLLAREVAKDRFETYKIVVNVQGKWLVYKEETSSWRLVGNGEVKGELAGTINDDSDADTGFAVRLGVDWNLLGGRPRKGEVLRAHLRHHYKDEAKEGPVFAFIEDAEGENSDYPTEWLCIVLK